MRALFKMSSALSNLHLLHFTIKMYHVILIRNDIPGTCNMPYTDSVWTSNDMDTVHLACSGCSLGWKQCNEHFILILIFVELIMIISQQTAVAPANFEQLHEI